jgi:hypothetical protein
MMAGVVVADKQPVLLPDGREAYGVLDQVVVRVIDLATTYSRGT